MDDADTVTVYAFELPGGDAEDFQLAPFKATRETIARQFGSRVLEGTAEEIDATLLDGAGRYRRVATGWGALA